jgi:hypothetical protein
MVARTYRTPIVLRVGVAGQYATIQEGIDAAAPPYSYLVLIAQGIYT